MSPTVMTVPAPAASGSSSASTEWNCSSRVSVKSDEPLEDSASPEGCLAAGSFITICCSSFAAAESYVKASSNSASCLHRASFLSIHRLNSSSITTLSLEMVSSWESGPAYPARLLPQCKLSPKPPNVLAPLHVDRLASH